MGLLHHEVTVLNFDHLYKQQPQLSDRADEWIELSNIPSTNLFCTREALAEIRRRLSARKTSGITYIGSGNHHYVSYAFLSEIDHPFSLVLFDNHTDAQQSDQLPGLLTCGSWVAEAITRLPLLQQVVWVGVQSDSFSGDPGIRSKMLLLPDLEHPGQLLSSLVADDIYISIDKDVLDEADAVTNWDQGKMRLKQLIMALHTLVLNKNVIGIDICGELRVAPGDEWKYSEQIRLNEKANLAILESLL
ncbi:arginase family protein [Brevibacillus massiliensis]|jgi:arginase family enzyme|uniref:arginase family protein n=1 Tax=Brevibacillus massiliensis TaxID=1118054 RepID=UPI0002F81975|nr:arginase family protein [Brevibacillus massiliensis]